MRIACRWAIQPTERRKPLSVRSDRKSVCQAIAGIDLGLTHFELDGVQIIAGPFATMTPFCRVSIRKMREEYRIDYDAGLIVARDKEMNLEALQHEIEAGDFLWKHNVYPKDFSSFSITDKKRPSASLISRIRSFLLEHSKSDHEAEAFARAGNTEFLKDCRRLKPTAYEQKLLARFAERLRFHR